MFTIHMLNETRTLGDIINVLMLIRVVRDIYALDNKDCNKGLRKKSHLIWPNKHWPEEDDPRQGIAWLPCLIKITSGVRAGLADSGLRGLHRTIIDPRRKK